MICKGLVSKFYPHFLYSQETEEEEKTPLEDVFKFDSELAKDEMDEDEDGEEDKGDDNDNDDEAEDANKKMSVSLEDLKDALNDDVATTTTDNDSESDFKECSSGAYGEELRCGRNANTITRSNATNNVSFLPIIIPPYCLPNEMCD